MGLRDWLQRRRQQSPPSDAPQPQEKEREDLQRKCRQLEWRCEDALSEASTERQLRKEALRQADCLTRLFGIFCTQRPAAEQLYQSAAPYLDPDGFQLYAAACHVTDIDIHGCFPYEENRGLFEGMDFPSMTRYLEAAHFGAVSWEIVPGATYERAILGKVDTAVPEYRAFRKEVCADALSRMGLGNLLKAKEQEVKEVEHER